MEYGPLDFAPYQLKSKKDAPPSGPSDRCCNPFTLMMEVFLVQQLSHAPSVLYGGLGRARRLPADRFATDEPGSGHQNPHPLMVAPVTPAG